MTTEQVLVVGRIAERLIICCLAGMSLSYGWNLFRAGILADQSADFAAGNWKANLKRVGPGTFFALFGATVLAIALHSPVQITTSQTEAARTNKYLFSQQGVTAIDAIDVEYQNHAISSEEAYKRLRQAILNDAPKAQ